MTMNLDRPRHSWDDWPGCAVNGCPLKASTRLDSPYCWPHTVDINAPIEGEPMKAEATYSEMTIMQLVRLNLAEWLLEKAMRIAPRNNYGARLEACVRDYMKEQP